MQTLLPVAHVRESHDLAINPDTLPGSGALTLVVSPYVGMATNDRVTITWRGFDSTGYADDADLFTSGKTLTAQDVGHALSWPLDNSYLLFIREGHGELSYSVSYATATGLPELSEVQSFRIVAPTAVHLPAPDIKDHSGNTIDPGDYPEGANVQIRGYPGIALGDQVLLHGSGRLGSPLLIRSVQVDQRIIDSGHIDVVLEQQWLQSNLNAQVSFAYQYARVGAGLSSEVLRLDVRLAWKPEAPVVIDAESEDGGMPNRGFIRAQELVAGAEVRIVPDPEVDLTSAERIEVRWKGFGVSGYYTTAEPMTGSPLRFDIPSSAVPANMGKRLDIDYQVKLPGQPLATSKAYDLRVIPIPQSNFRTLKCALAPEGKLRLANVPNSGVEFELARWVFMAAGQHVTIQASQPGSAAEYLLKEFEVRPDQLAAGKVMATLSRDYLVGVGVGARLTVAVEVSFDEGNAYLDFPSIAIEVV